MKKIFVSYEISKQLKEKGFKEPCLACYDGSEMLSTYSTLFEPKNYNVGGGKNTSAPLYQEVVDWLDNKGICIFISPYEAGTSKGSDLTFIWEIINKETKLMMKTEHSCYDERTQALKVAIEEALKLVN